MSNFLFYFHIRPKFRYLSVLRVTFIDDSCIQIYSNDYPHIKYKTTFYYSVYTSERLPIYTVLEEIL